MPHTVNAASGRFDPTSWSDARDADFANTAADHQCARLSDVDAAARPSTRVQMLNRNERRLNALTRRGVRIVVNGRDVLEFILDQFCLGIANEEFQHGWARDLAALLDRIESEAWSTNDPTNADAGPCRSNSWKVA